MKKQRHVPCGELHPHSILTEEKVLYAVRLYREGKRSIRGLARDIGIGYVTIRNIMDGKKWRHVTGGEAVIPICKASRKERGFEARALSQEEVLTIRLAYIAGEDALSIGDRLGVSWVGVCESLFGKGVTGVPYRRLSVQDMRELFCTSRRRLRTA